jgi:hypothetical protein
MEDGWTRYRSVRGQMATPVLTTANILMPLQFEQRDMVAISRAYYLTFRKQAGMFCRQRDFSGQSQGQGSTFIRGPGTTVSHLRRENQKGPLV